MSARSSEAGFYDFRTVLLAGTILTLLPVQSFAQEVLLEPVPVETTQPQRASAPSAAPAQSAAASDDEQTDEESADGPVNGIVAKKGGSATKTDTPILETPATINVIGTEEMEQRGASSVGEALLYTPGVIPGARVSTRYDIGSIRGFGGQSWFDYVDGMRMLRGGFNAPIMDSWNIERIEVLKGPASVLYGQVMPGGLVNQVTKKPEEETSREVQVTLGYPDRFEAAFDFTGAVNDDKTFLYRLVGLGRYEEGNVDFSETERWFAAPSVTWKPSDQTSLTLEGGYLNDPSSFYAVYLPTLGTAARHPSGHQIPYDFAIEDPHYSKFEREQAWVGYEFRHAFNTNIEFRSKLRYMDVESWQRGMTPFGWDGPMPTTTMSTRLSRTNDLSRSVTMDNQLQLDFDTGPIGHEVLIGADYQHLDFSRYIVSGVVGPTIDYLNPTYGPIPIPDYNNYFSEDREQFGIYAQDQLEFGRLLVTLGARYDWAKSDYDHYTYNAATGVKTYTDAGSNEADQEAATWRAGVIYPFDNGLAPYASYATSFEPVSGTTIGGDAFEPTTGEQFEVGVKYEPSWFNGVFTLSLFEITQQNVLQSSGIADPLCSTPANCQIQTGEIRSRGVEFEAKAELFEGFDLIGSYAYVDAETTEAEDPAQVGLVPTAVPKHQASLWANYTFGDGMLAGLGVGAGVRYIGETYGAVDNSFKVPSYTLVDLGLSYDFGALRPNLQGLKLNVAVTNLFDKEYLSSCGSSNSSVTGLCFYGAGRAASATLSYKW